MFYYLVFEHCIKYIFLILDASITMIVLKVIICYLLLQLSATQSAANFTKPCYKENYADDQSVWLLQWEDNFERKKLTETNEWDVQHESHFCGGKLNKNVM